MSSGKRFSRKDSQAGQPAELLQRLIGQIAAEAQQRQGEFWSSAAYCEEAPALRSPSELAAALEHIEYAIYRRFSNQLNRSERARLENTIRNTLFKIDRFLVRSIPTDGDSTGVAERVRAAKAALEHGREHEEQQHRRAMRIDLKLKRLSELTPEEFEDYVADLFEFQGYATARVGGPGDEGVDLVLRKANLKAVVQCKYYSKGLIGSPDLQKFLGTVEHTRSQKGYFVTASSFTLAAERFAAQHPLELIDGPGLIALVEDALRRAHRPGKRVDPVTLRAQRSAQKYTLTPFSRFFL